jgi:predicted nucleotide-binding protein
MPKVFIVHGHDHEARNDLTKLLKRMGITPIVLSKTLDGGTTIIEKFEKHACQCEFAIVLLTPDDKSAGSLRASEKYRARQNVIFEMGWFYAKLGRHKTLLIYRGKVELPSDVTGILYKKFSKSPVELKSEISAALKAGGVRLKSKVK